MTEIEKHIQEYGWHYIFVFDPDGIRTEFAYTIGLEESFNHPEIAIFGLRNETAHAILTNIVDDIRAGSTMKLNTNLKNVIGGNLEVMFKPLKESVYVEYFGRAVDYYGKRFRVQVMLWPDKFNVLPTEKGSQALAQKEALDLLLN